MFPIGSKPKRLLVSPATAMEPFLIPGHKYLFKVATGWQSQQLWSEILAYEIARPLGLSVPPCFVAVDSQTREVGVLIEFFYGYPDYRSLRNWPTEATCFKGFFGRESIEKGLVAPIYFERIALCRALTGPSATAWWAQTIAFDAMIGNTDRHPENWGILVERSELSRPLTYKIAPIFDNGTSLGYELSDEALREPWATERLRRYIARGTHHCGLTNLDERGAGHVDLCLHIKQIFPAAGAAIESVVQLADSYVENVVNWCAGFECPVPFSAKRAAFVGSLVKARRDQLVHAIGR